MFGKTRDLNDTANLDGSTIEDFFGDESAAAEVVRVDELRHRVSQVESQINSQFTSLATYAQIAQEQIELARAEARASTERSEQRVTELIERERADRIVANTGSAPVGSNRDISARLDALEHDVAQIRATLDGCFAQQLALADAISKLFESTGTAPLPAPPADLADALPAPTAQRDQRRHWPLPAPDTSVAIPGLSLCLDIA
jgi:hypothetical protein